MEYIVGGGAVFFAGRDFHWGDASAAEQAAGALLGTAPSGYAAVHGSFLDCYRAGRALLSGQSECLRARGGPIATAPGTMQRQRLTPAAVSASAPQAAPWEAAARALGAAGVRARGSR